MQKQTSMLVFIDKVKPNITKRESEVLEALKQIGGQGSMYDISMLINRPINCYSGRFTALEKKGMIYNTNKVSLNQGGNKCIVWGVCE